MGPLIVLSRNLGGAYIVTELDGSVFDRPVAAFRVVPYFARSKLDIPPIEDLIDISRSHLAQLEQSGVVDPDDDDELSTDD